MKLDFMIDSTLLKEKNKKIRKCLITCFIWSLNLNRGQTIDVKSHMDTLNYFYGVTILELVLQHNDNSSRTLQKHSTTACHGKVDNQQWKH